MSEIVPAVPDGVLVVPGVGEVVSLESPQECVRALRSVRELEGMLRDAKRVLTAQIAAECARQGTKTLRYPGVQAELRGGEKVIWDVEVLERLRDMGLPEERWDTLVRAEVTYKVDAREAARISAANPEYAKVIGLAKTVVDGDAYVTVKT